ncbi:MAG: hypothetical protein FWF78_02655 [Defluviitaleaceae bacterium]|nr:hypothetical protein [Defluviitaleaceae bacterium]
MSIFIILIFVLAGAAIQMPSLTLSSYNPSDTVSSESYIPFVSHYIGFGFDDFRYENFPPEFFEDNYIVLFSFAQPTTELGVVVDRVEASGDIVLRRRPFGVAGDAISSWMIIIELCNSFAPDEFNVTWWENTPVHVYRGNSAEYVTSRRQVSEKLADRVRAPIMENVRYINNRGASGSPIFILTEDDELWTHIGCRITSVESEYFPWLRDYSIIPGTSELIMEDVAGFHSMSFDRFVIKNDNSLWWLQSYLMPFDGIIHMMDNVARVSSFQSSHAILTLDGRLYTWNHATSEPVFFMENVQDFSMQHTRLSAIHTKDGGFYRVYQGEAIRVLENISRYYTRDFTVALTHDGTLYSIRSGEATRLLENVRETRINRSAVFAITYDNTLWGYGRSNEYWFGPDNPRLETPQILMENVDRLSGGMSVIDTDGALWMWGRNAPPLVGLDAQNPSRIMDNVDSVITSGERAAYIMTNCGDLWGFGVVVARMIYANPNVIQEYPMHISSSRGRAMQEPLHLLNNVQSFVDGVGFRAMAIDDDNVLWVWGFPNNSTIGEVVTGPFHPVRVMEDVAYVTTGFVITTGGDLWEFA